MVRGLQGHGDALECSADEALSFIESRRFPPKQTVLAGVIPRLPNGGDANEGDTEGDTYEKDVSSSCDRCGGWRRNG
ncbi:MAG: hypothetical protein KGL62_17790, partial [Bradyrhizobium sp.]|uniref:hypothetical protein n=1 Tax=Bradyrhizobium sp. TaxID=376 RepID=UPI0023A37BE6